MERGRKVSALQLLQLVTPFALPINVHSTYSLVSFDAMAGVWSHLTPDFLLSDDKKL